MPPYLSPEHHRPPHAPLPKPRTSPAPSAPLPPRPFLGFCVLHGASCVLHGASCVLHVRSRRCSTNELLATKWGSVYGMYCIKLLCTWVLVFKVEPMCYRVLCRTWGTWGTGTEGRSARTTMALDLSGVLGVRGQLSSQEQRQRTAQQDRTATETVGRPQTKKPRNPRGRWVSLTCKLFKPWLT